MSEDELRAALEDLASMPVEQLLVGTIQTLVNVTLLRLGLVEGIDGAVDRGQARVAIDAIAALETVVGPRMPPEAAERAAQRARVAAPRLHRRRRRRRRPGRWRRTAAAATSARAGAAGDLDAAGQRLTPLATVGVFGGSGFYAFLDDVEEVAVDTPVRAAVRPAVHR